VQFMRQCRKTVVQPDRPRGGACVLHAA